MKSLRPILPLLFTALCAGTAAQAQSFQWAKTVKPGPNSVFGNAEPRGTVLDQSGNVIAAIKNFGDTDIGGQLYYSPDSAVTISIVKYDPQGNVTWVQRFGGLNYNGLDLTDLEIDDSGNIYALGNFYTQLPIGGQVLTPGQNQGDYFVAKFNASGALQWVSSGGGSGRRTAQDMSIDPAGNIVLAGSFVGTSNFGTYSLTYSGNPGTGLPNAFCAKLDPAGMVQWASGAVGQPGSYTNAKAAGTDQAGNIYLAGSFQGSFSWGSATLTAPSGNRTFWMKFNPAGQPLDHFNIEQSDYNYVPDLAVDAAGYSYLSTPFKNTINVGGISLSAGTSINSYLASYDPNGVLQWAKQFSGGTSNNHSIRTTALALDGQGKLYATGHFNSDVTVGSVTLSTVGSRFSTFVTAFDLLTGQALWGATANGPSYVLSAAVGVNAAGQLGLVGEFTTGPVTFGNQSTGSGVTGNKTATFITKLLQNYNTLAGSIFLDANSNGTQDANETGYAGGLIEVAPGPLQVSSDGAGAYQAVVGQGSYAVSFPNPPLYYNLVASGSASGSFSSFGNQAAGPNYALQPIAGQQDLRVLLTAITPARPGLTTSYRLTYRNLGTVPMPAGTVSMAFDNRMTYLSSSQPATQTGNTLSWSYSNLLPGQERNVNVLFQLPTSLQAGDTLSSTASILPLTGDLTPADNEETSQRIVVASFDPNSIEVNYQKLSTAQVQAGEWLTYTIRFQNMGTDTAFSIMLQDALPAAQLRLSTLQLLAASHNCVWSVSSDGKLTVQFTSIKLPHQGVNLLASNGFVRFRVRPVSSLTVGTIIPNQAQIYFDFNAPVNTNTATTEIDQVLSRAGAAAQAPVQVWPNPAHGTVNVEAQLPTAAPVSLRLLDATGRVVLQQSRSQAAGSFRQQLEVSHLPAGLYLLELQAGSSRTLSKVTLR